MEMWSADCLYCLGTSWSLALHRVIVTISSLPHTGETDAYCYLYLHWVVHFLRCCGHFVVRDRLGQILQPINNLGLVE